MEQFKVTQKGTQLPLLNLKGKPYLQVAHRVVWFREEHPQGKIITEIVSLTDTKAVVKTTLMDKDSNILSTAHKMEEKAHFPDFLEKAETGSSGRALALAGYGTQFEPELDEGVRLADSPMMPAIPAHKKEAKETAESKKSSAPTTGGFGASTINTSSKVGVASSVLNTPSANASAGFNTNGTSVNTNASTTNGAIKASSGFVRPGAKTPPANPSEGSFS